MTPKECSIQGHPEAVKSVRFHTGTSGHWKVSVVEPVVNATTDITAYCPLCQVALVEKFD